MKLVVPRFNQYVFNEVVEAYLQRIAFSDGFARLIRLKSYGDADVVLDPARGYGRPIFDRAGVTVDNVFGALRAGDSIEDTAEDYVIATGRAHSVHDFVAAAFAAAGIADWEPLIRQDAAFMRPADPSELVGDATLARDVLGWTPTVAFEEIVARMVATDLS